MANKIERFRKDPRGIIFGKAEYYRLKVYCALSTAAARVFCYLRGIHLGSKCSFYGIPIFRRNPSSMIIIGDKCIFRSGSTSNLAGLNRKCIIATHRENAEIIIGKNSGFSGTVIGAARSIQIGNDVLCGANVLITDFDWHNIAPDTRHKRITNFKPIIIGDNVWLGANTVVLKGVQIQKNSVVGANSLVVGNIPENVIAGGNPCKVIRKIFED